MATRGNKWALLPWYTPCANKRCDFTTPTICSTLGNTKVLVLDREEDPIALQPEDDWVLAKDLRQGEEKAMRKAMGGIGPQESYDWLRIWEEVTTAHGLMRPVDFQVHTFSRPLICSAGKPCADCRRKRRREEGGGMIGRRCAR